MALVEDRARTRVQIKVTLSFPPDAGAEAPTLAVGAGVAVVAEVGEAVPTTVVITGAATVIWLESGTYK